MARRYRDLGRLNQAAPDYDDYAYRSYDRRRGAGGYRDRDPAMREGLLGDPVGMSYLGGRSGGFMGGGVGGYDRESELMDTLLHQRELQQQLSLRESQLALVNSLLLQQEQQQQPWKSSWMEGARGGGDFREDFKHARVIRNRAQPKNRSTGQDANAGGKGARGGSGNQRNQNGPNGYAQGSADSERMQDGSKKPRKPKKGPRKESDDGVSPRTESRSSANDSGLKSADRDRSRGSGESCDPEGRSVDDDAGEEKSRSRSWCSLCNVDCKDKEELRQHKISSLHKKNVANFKGEDGDPKRPERKGYCYICDVPLNVTFKYHQRQTRHKLEVEKKKVSKKRKVQVIMGCGWCKIASFKNFSEVLAHRATEKHIENQALYGKKDKDKKTNSEGDLNGKTSRKGQDSIKVELPPELSEFDPTVMVGESCMIDVTGWFCKVCHKFCNSENTAKEEHCKTETHFNNYKKFTYNKLKAEAKREAKQKAAEEAQKTKEAEDAAEAEAAENKEGTDDDSASNASTKAGATTAPPTEQPEVDSGKLTNGVEGAKPAGTEVGESGTEAGEGGSKGGAEGGEEDGWVEDGTASEDSAESSPESDEDQTGSVATEQH